MPELNLPEVSVSNMLPFGVTIRPLLVQSCLTDSDLNNMLRERGVFVGNVDKQNLVPLIMKMVMSPDEFETLFERQKSKEEAPKRHNTHLSSTTQNTMFAALNGIDISSNNMMPTSVQNSDFHTPISVSATGSNEVTYSYTIIRHDLTKDWVQPQSTHKGVVTLTKDASTGDVKVSSEYTSKETDEINRLICKTCIAHLKQNGEVGTEEKRILPGDFTNRERFNFLLRIAGDNTDGSLRATGIRDLEIGPDPKDPPATGTGIISDNVRKLIINGKNLEQNLTQITNADKDHLILRSLQVDFDVDFQGKKVRCCIDYGFLHFFRNQNTDPEFQYSIRLAKLQTPTNEVAVRKFIADVFECHRDRVYGQMMADKAGVTQKT